MLHTTAAAKHIHRDKRQWERDAVLDPLSSVALNSMHQRQPVWLSWRRGLCVPHTACKASAAFVPGHLTQWTGTDSNARRVNVYAASRTAHVSRPAWWTSSRRRTRCCSRPP